jgi:hypothetical protein
MNLIHVYTREQAIDDGVLTTLDDYVRNAGGLSTPELLAAGWELIRRNEEAKFPLGQLVITPAAAEALHLVDALTCLMRHQLGDWGEVGEEDELSNEQALKHGHRLFSVYRVNHQKEKDQQVRCYIITEWNREATTLLLPGDY